MIPSKPSSKLVDRYRGITVLSLRFCLERGRHHEDTKWAQEKDPTADRLKNTTFDFTMK
jgi:hypothetical protein